MKKCGLHFVGYGKIQKLDGSMQMRSMEYEGEMLDMKKMRNIKEEERKI